MGDTENTTNPFMNITESLMNVTDPMETTTKVDIWTVPEWIASYWLDQVNLFTLTIIGCIGNTMSVVTILRMSPVGSSSLYVVFLAIMDSISLALKLTYQQLTKYDVRMGDAGCRALLHFANTAVMTANWLVVAMTAERMIAIWFPLRVSEISTKKKTCILLAFFVVFFMCINVIYLYMFFETWSEYYKFYCAPLPEYSVWMDDVFWTIDACFYALIPCATLVLLNSLIIFGTWRSASILKKMTHNQDQIDEKRKQQHQITIMLVTVSIIFTLLTIPNAVWFMTSGGWITNSVKEFATKDLTGRIILFFSDLNHAVNFFLYFLSGRRFRQMFLKMLGCKGTGQKKSKYDTTLNSYVSGTKTTGATSVSNVSGNVD